MKKLLYFSGIFAVMAITISCSKKFDNYAEPAETFAGKVTNGGKEGLQTEIGGGGTRIKMEELSWSDNPTPYYFYCLQDGSFNNTKIFKGRYRVSVEGPFVPLVQTDSSGNVTVDNSQTLDIAGVTTLDFSVEPFLNVTWMSEPVYNSEEGTITVQAKFSRGTSNPDFQSNISDVFFFVNTNPYVGNNNYDNRYSTQVTYSGTEGNDDVDQTVTITSREKLPTGRTYYLRIGARVDFGLKYYNYSDIKTIQIP